MVRISGFSLYSQERFDDREFLASFVARLKNCNALLNGLRNMARGGPPEHQILVGARGMGKTSLLRRISIGIGEDPELTSAFIPLRFREEQYNIISLEVFWRNCGESLAEHCEQVGLQAMADQLDREIETVEWRDPNKARDGFLAACRTVGGRPILLLDNLDLILAGIKTEGCWLLRNALQRSDGPIIVGAATQLLSEGADRDAPFYEFFHPHILEPLTESELLACLNALADRRGEVGVVVKATLASNPARVRALYALSGGNPRILTLIYGLLEQADNETIFTDLEALLDQVTPLYKARIEEYQTPLQRAVIDGIALNWDPITSGALSQQTGVEVTTLSAQIIRLKRDGLIEEVETSGARAGYQLSERFLNIWYLMRHGTRKTKQRLRWFTLFLTKLFNADELRRMAGEAKSKSASSHPFYREALDDACDILSSTSIGFANADELRSFNAASVPNASDIASGNLPDEMSGEESELIRLAAQVDQLSAASKYAEILDLKPVAFDSGAVSNYERENLIARIKNLRGNALTHQSQPVEAIVAFDEVLARIGGSSIPYLQQREIAALRNKANALSMLGRNQKASIIYDDIVSRFGESRLAQLQLWISSTLVAQGRHLRKLKHYKDAVEVFDRVVQRFGNSDQREVLEDVALALVNKVLSLNDLKRHLDAIEICKEIVARFEASDVPILQVRVAWAHNEHGRQLSKLKQYEHAIGEFDQVVQRFGNSDQREALEQVAIALGQKAWSLDRMNRGAEAGPIWDEILERFEASEETYLQPHVSWALLGRGLTLKQLKQTEEAITVFDHLIEKFRRTSDQEVKRYVTNAVIERANCLVEFGKIDEAITCLNEEASNIRTENKVSNTSGRESIANIEFEIGWIHFCYLNDLPRAETAFREAIALGNRNGIESVPPRANLCWVLLAGSKLDGAREVFASIDEFTGAGRHLWQAGLDIVAGDVQSSLAHLGKVLEVGFESDGFEYFEALLWYLRIAADHDRGEELIEWFIVSDFANRYAPLYGAFVAHVRGEHFLLDLNPEIRNVARPLYSRLSAGRPKSQAAAKSRRGSGRKR